MCLRPTGLQKRLNYIAISHIYADMIDNLDITFLLNEFLAKDSKRVATFAILKNSILCT